MSNYYVKTTDNSNSSATVSSGGVPIQSLSNTFSGTVSITNNTASTNSTTGALIVSGGVGISGNMFSQGAINIQNATASTTSTTGALVVSGGVGIAGLLNSANINNVGLFQSTQSTDLFTTGTFSSTPSFSLSGGMVYYLSSNSTTVSSVSFINIPITQQSTLIFTFLILPTTASSAWYLKPSSNLISITPVGLAANNSVPLYGLSNVSLPTSYTYLIQQITIVNTSTSSTPSFIAFTNISAY